MRPLGIGLIVLLNFHNDADSSGRIDNVSVGEILQIVPAILDSVAIDVIQRELNLRGQFLSQRRL